MQDVVVENEQDVPDSFPGEFSVATLEPVTDAHSGLIEITFRNSGDSSFSGRLPFGSRLGRSKGRSAIVLLSEDIYAPGYIEQRASGWWDAEMFPDHAGVYSESLASGEEISKRFVVLAHPETRPPREGERFVFEDGFDRPPNEFEWGFTLTTV